MASEEPWVMYKDRPQWSDMVPIKQNDSPYPVVKILYSENFTDIYDYLRGVMAVKELSNRALGLTGDAIEMNAANYTVWRYRRLILEATDSDFQQELHFCREMIEDNPKNYQVWHHRRVIADWLGDGGEEKRLTAIIFSQDAKNYHAWEHRQWALTKFNLYEGELDFTEKLIQDDARNNSAWNHRFFVLKQTTDFTPSALQPEIEFTKKSIAALPGNESPWSFLKGLLSQCKGEKDSLYYDTEMWAWKEVGRQLPKDTSTQSTDRELVNNDSPATDEEFLRLATTLSAGDVDTQLVVGLLDLVTYRLRISQDDPVSRALTKIVTRLCELLMSQDDLRAVYWKALCRRLTAQTSPKIS